MEEDAALVVGILCAKQCAGLRAMNAAEQLVDVIAAGTQIAAYARDQ